MPGCHLDRGGEPRWLFQDLSLACCRWGLCVPVLLAISNGEGAPQTLSHGLIHTFAFVRRLTS